MTKSFGLKHHPLSPALFKMVTYCVGLNQNSHQLFFPLSLGGGIKNKHRNKKTLWLGNGLYHPAGTLILFTNVMFPPYLYKPCVARNYSFKLFHLGPKLGCNSFQLNWRWLLGGSPSLCSVVLTLILKKKKNYPATQQWTNTKYFPMVII